MMTGTVTAVNWQPRPYSYNGKSYEAYKVTVQGEQGMITAEKSVMAGNLAKLQNLLGKKVLYEIQTNNHGTKFVRLDDASAPPSFGSGVGTRRGGGMSDDDKERIFVQGVVQAWLQGAGHLDFPSASFNDAIVEIKSAYALHFGPQGAQVQPGGTGQPHQQQYAPTQPPAPAGWTQAGDAGPQFDERNPPPADTPF